MFTLNGIRNAFYCAIAFGIIACASAPGPMENQAVAENPIERAGSALAAQLADDEHTDGERAIPGRAATGAP